VGKGVPFRKLLVSRGDMPFKRKSSPFQKKKKKGFQKEEGVHAVI